MRIPEDMVCVQSGAVVGGVEGHAIKMMGGARSHHCLPDSRAAVVLRLRLARNWITPLKSEQTNIFFSVCDCFL